MNAKFERPKLIHQGEWVARFIFIAGRISIDFAQTGGRTPDRAIWERLQSPSDLADWLAESPLQLSGVTVSPEEFDLALDLREAIWYSANAVRQGLLPDPAHLDTLNQVAALPNLAPQLQADVLTSTWRQPYSARAALATIARDCIDLYAGEWRGRLRQCENPRCSLMFVDQSRPGKRRWCLMERCGNIEKTNRYRQRQKNL